MNDLITLGSVTGKTRGVSMCGQIFEGVCANVNGVLYKTYTSPQFPCHWVVY